MNKSVFPLNESSGIDLAMLRQLIQEGSGINLSTQTKDETEPLIVYSKIANFGQDTVTNEQDFVKRSEQVWSHFFERFAILCRWKDIENLGYFTPGLALTTHMCRKHEDTYVVLASGDLAAWHRLCLFGCDALRTKEFRWICNQVWEHLRKSYGDALSDWTKESNRDGTFVLQWSPKKKR